jgi:ribosome-associated heat shock protein Hsp15
VILLPTPPDVSAYMASGRDVVPPAVRCPACGGPTGPWSGYRRHLRADALAVRLSCCRARSPVQPSANRDRRQWRRNASSTRGIIDRVTDPTAADETRIDRWLCAVRLVKTRPLATRLCDGGHVLVNGLPAKPATKVRAGDRVAALIADRERVIEVVRPIESRVGAPAAATCYVDHSPPVVTEAEPGMMRIRGEGRPGKRLRRELERLRRAADA